MPYTDKLFQYILLVKAPINYEELGVHELLRLAENAETNVALYKHLSDQLQKELLRRIENDGPLDSDPDFVFRITWEPDEDGPAIDVRWREGRRVNIYNEEQAYMLNPEASG